MCLDFSAVYTPVQLLLPIEGLVPRLQTPDYIHDSLVPRLVCEPGNETTYTSEQERTYLLTNR